MKFVMTQAVCPEGLALLKDKAEIYVADNGDVNNYLDQMQDADAIIVRIAKMDRHAIENSPNLKVIGRTGVGCDSVDVEAATERGIPVVSIHDKTDGIIFPVMGIQIGADLIHRVGIIVENKHFRIFGKAVEIKVLCSFGIHNNQIMRIGRKRVGKRKRRSGVVGKIGIQEIRNIGRVLLCSIRHIGKVTGALDKLLSRVLLNGVGTGQPRALILYRRTGILNRRTIRTGVFRHGLRHFLLALGFGNVMLLVGIGIVCILNRFHRLGGSRGLKQHAILKSEDLNLSLSSLLSHDRSSFPTILFLFFRLNQ